MKLLIKSRDLSLLAAVNTARLIIPRRSTLPILEHVALSTDAENDCLMVHGNNLEQAVRIKVAAKIEDAGAIVVPSKPLVAFLQLAGNTKIDMAVVKNKLILTSGNMESEIDGFDMKDYPPIVAPGKDPLKFSCSQFIEALKDVVYAAATDDSRPILTGVNVKQISPRKAQTATADGFRLAIHDFSIFGQSALPEDVIIPSRVVSMLSKIMPDVKSFNLVMKTKKSPATDTEVQVPDRMEFESGGIWFVTQLLDGKFPQYEQIIPQSFEHTVTVAKSDLEKAIEGVAKLNPGSGITRLLAIDGKLAVTASDEGIGKVSFKIDCTGDFKGAYNFKYLKEALPHCGELVTLHGAPGTPGLIKTPNGLTVLMPMFVQW